MDSADRLGLLPGFGWLTGHGFLFTLLLCWLITPVGHLVVGFVGESRFIPIAPDKQFLSFFPGDLLLGMMAAGLLVQAQQLPSASRWYNATWWHTTVLAAALLVAFIMTYAEWRSGVYPSRAILSPSKLYHNVLLYGGYGYVIVVTLVAVLAQVRSWWIAAALVPGLVWAALVVRDNSLSEQRTTEIARHAHVEQWSPIWRLP